MWYVIQVMGGQEEKTAFMMRKQIKGDAMRECFIPKKERLKKFGGRWQPVEEKLFPGYVFADSEDVEELYRQLKAVTGLTKVLRDGEFYFIPLVATEIEKINILSDPYHIIRLSRINILKNTLEGKETIVVLDGPLKGKEGNVVKIFLHQRVAVIRMLFLGKMLDVKLGIEILG